MNLLKNKDTLPSSRTTNSKVLPASPATLGSDEIEARLARIAQRVVALRLETASLLLLEAHKPFLTIAHTGSLFLAPIALPFFGAERVSLFQQLLADKGVIERLCQMIETYSLAQKQKN